MSLFSLFHILAIIGSAKDVYLEKFGADATAIGCLFSVAWSGEHDRAVFVPGSIDILSAGSYVGILLEIIPIFCWFDSPNLHKKCWEFQCCVFQLRRAFYVAMMGRAVKKD